MVKTDSGECIWEFAQKMRSSDMGLMRIPETAKTSRKPKKTIKPKKQCFQNYSDLWTSCQIFGFLVFLVLLFFWFYCFFWFLEVFFQIVSVGAVQ